MRSETLQPSSSPVPRLRRRGRWSSSASRWLLLLGLLSTAACHPAACMYPRAYPSEPGFELETTDDRFPVEPIEFVFDELGIAHAYAQSEADLAFAQGFLHGRDRRSQLELYRAFGWGRLTELLGPDFLDFDRMSRLQTWNLDEEVAELEMRPEVIDILEAYAAGINVGVNESGQTPEMLVTGWLQGLPSGHPFRPWTVEDSVAFSRGLSFRLVTGMTEELARTRILNRIESTDPRLTELLQVMGDLGAPIVTAEDNTGDATTDPRSLIPVPPDDDTPIAPRPLLPLSHPAAAPRPELPLFAERLFGQLKTPMGSNAWAVSGTHTESGNAILSHDPHLTHDGPSFIYMLHLESPDMTAAGLSFPGVPGVLMGHGRSIAWGGPVSNIDSKDLVKIEPYEGRDDLYLLDARPVPYEIVTQRFRLGPGPTAEVFEETWKLTRFGPVLPPAFQHLHDEGEEYALLWPAFSQPADVDGTPPNYMGTLSFWDLAKASNPQQAHDAIDDMVTNAQTLVFATQAGDIGLRASGSIPVRLSDEPVGYPRDGRRSSAGWAGRLPGTMKPQLDNPASGYIIAANQRIVSPGGPRDAIVGDEAIHPYRAARIKERLDGMLNAGPVSVDDLLNLQLDIESVAARDLAPALGRSCPQSLVDYEDDLVQRVCEDIRLFDGVYDVDSRGALLFRRLERVVRRKILEAHLGDEVAAQVQSEHFIRFNIHRRILEADAGSQPALLNDPATAEREGLLGFVTRSLPEVIDSLVGDPALGPDPANWRWGAVHTLTVKGALSVVPGVGAAFTQGPTELDGCGTCVRAEAGDTSVASPESGEAVLNPDAVFAGAVFRMIAEMGDPITVKMIMDTGSSGHFGHPHAYDQFPLWANGTPVQVVRNRELIEADATERLTILAAP